MIAVIRQKYLLIFLFCVTITALLFGGYRAFENREERRAARDWMQHSEEVFDKSRRAAQFHTEAVMRGRTEFVGASGADAQISKADARRNTLNALNELSAVVGDNILQVANVQEITKAVQEKWETQDLQLIAAQRDDSKLITPLSQTKSSIDADRRVEQAFAAFNEQERVLQTGRNVIFLNLDEKYNNTVLLMYFGALVAVSLFGYFARRALQGRLNLARDIKIAKDKEGGITDAQAEFLIRVAEGKEG